jgi:hypothetical protein
LLFSDICFLTFSHYEPSDSQTCALQHSVALQRMTWVVRDAHKQLLGSLAASMNLSSTMPLDREDQAPTQLPQGTKQDSSCHSTVSPLTWRMLMCWAPAAAMSPVAGT